MVGGKVVNLVLLSMKRFGESKNTKNNSLWIIVSIGFHGVVPSLKIRENTQFNYFNHIKYCQYIFI